MGKSRFVFIAVIGWLLLPVVPHAQETNAPKTRLEAFEAQTGTVILRATAPVGSVYPNTGAVSVTCKESTDTRTGRKEYGILVGIKEGERPEETTVIDYDEADSFLEAIAYIGKINYTVTSLPSFDAVYTTRGELRLAIYSSHRRPGTLQAVLQVNQPGRLKVFLAADQLAQFQNLIQQAKSKLDSLRANK